MSKSVLQGKRSSEQETRQAWMVSMFFCRQSAISSINTVDSEKVLTV